MLPITLFFYGFLAGCAGLLLQILFLTFFGEETTITNPGLVFLFAAALAEETTKLLFLIQAFRRYAIPSLTLPSLLLFGFGFALIEVLLFFFAGSSSREDIPLLPLSANILVHLATTLFLGFLLKYFPFPGRFVFGGLAFVTLLHALYNLFRLNT